MKKLVSTIVLAAASLAIAGCGGGSGASVLSSGTGSSGSSSSGSGSGTSTSTLYQIGSGSGSSFQPGAIAIASASLSAGGSTSLTVSVVDQKGNLYSSSTAPLTVTFNSTCIAQGLAVVTASGASTTGSTPNTVTTSSGTINATYTAKGCSGSDVITATTSINSATLSATGTVNVAAATAGSIQFISATPTTIGLKGTGQPTTSTVTFKVLDSTGAPLPNAKINFSLNSTVGGMALAPTSAVSAADGTVQTVVSSGTVHTVVTVTASLSASGSSPALTTQSSNLTVTTGIPASAAFSIAESAAQYGSGGTSNVPACPNVEAWNTDGVVVPITVRLADRYNNPVLDGTAVTFYTNGGHIQGSCTTSGGSCSVNWTSANPRPLTNSDNPPLLANGRVMILATTIGEESFTDLNGDGFWEPGEPFQNLGEPYDDANQNGQYDAGEYFLDYNQNGKWDAGDGTFKGITCTGTTASSTCSTTLLAIGAQQLIIMSSGQAQIRNITAGGGFSGTSSGLTITHGQSGSITFNVADINNNPIPAGSTIAVSADSTVGTVSSTTSTFTEGCSTAVGGDNFTSYVTAASSAGSGNITITVTSAGTKTVTSTVIPVTVN